MERGLNCLIPLSLSAKDIEAREVNQYPQQMLGQEPFLRFFNLVLIGPHLLFSLCVCVCVCVCPRAASREVGQSKDNLVKLISSSTMWVPGVKLTHETWLLYPMSHLAIPNWIDETVYMTFILQPMLTSGLSSFKIISFRLHF